MKRFDTNSTLNRRYLEQATDNIHSFLNEPKFADRRNALFLLADMLDGAGITWGLGCSFSMFAYGIIDDFHDFDLLSTKSGFRIAMEIMRFLGAEILLETEEDPTIEKGFCSRYFATVVLPRNAEVDVIADFGIKAFNCKYRYQIDEGDLDFFAVGNHYIPIIPAEPLFVLYRMMVDFQPNRRYKVERLGEYLDAGNVRHQNLLEEALLFELDEDIEKEIKYHISRP